MIGCNTKVNGSTEPEFECEVLFMRLFSGFKVLFAFSLLLVSVVEFALFSYTSLATHAADISLKHFALISSASLTTTPPLACGSWNVVSSPNPSSTTNILNAVVAVSMNNVWAVGLYNANPSNTLIEHWDGTSWNVVPSPNPGADGNVLSGVAAVSANNIWAVGYDNLPGGVPSQTLIEHWDGISWSVLSSPNPSTIENKLYGIAVVSANNIWAVGYAEVSNGSQLIEHWDGTSWSVVANPSPPPLGSILYGVTAVSAKNIWAVGAYSVNYLGLPQTLIEHWNGTSWSVVSSPNIGTSDNFLFGAARVPRTKEVWAVGYYNIGPPGKNVFQALIEKWNGKRWKVVPSPSLGSNNNSLDGLTAISKNNVWAVGFYDNGLYQTLIEHWDGTNWSVVSGPNIGTGPNVLNAVARVPDTSDIWAVGSYNTGRSGQTLIEFYC